MCFCDVGESPADEQDVCSPIALIDGPRAGFTTEESHRQDACATTKLLVAESGIHTRADVERLKKCGANAILVGESLMRGGDIKSKIRELIG